MEVMLGLAAVVFVLILLVGTPAALWLVVLLRRDNRALTRRVSALEREMRGLREGGPTPRAAAPPLDEPEPAPPIRDEPVAAEPGPRPEQAARTSSVPPVAAARPPRGPRRPALPDRVAASLRQHWLIWIAALSLAFGGVFLVQYGIEQGLLGPAARVASAALLGLGLLAAAERLRLRAGQIEGVLDPAAAFAAGGVSALFTAAFSAHFLYGLVGPGTGFAAMAAVAVAAILHGTRHGPVLSVIGVLGGYATPLLIEGGEPSPLLYLYVLLIAATALGIERWQRWAWLSAAAVGLAFLWGLAIAAGSAPDVWHAPFVVALAALAVTVPEFGLPPRSATHTMISESVARRTVPYYPTLLGSLSMVAGIASLWLSAPMGPAPAIAGLMAALALILFGIVVCRQAESLDDGAIATAFGLLPLLALVAWIPAPDLAADPDPFSRRHEVVPGRLRLLPWSAATAVAAVAVVFAGSLVRTDTGHRPALWSAVAALFPPAVLVVFWYDWSARTGLPDATWGILALLLAVPMVAAARRFRQTAARMELPVGILATGALGLVALGAGLALSDTPLTLAFAAIALAAVVLDRRFDLMLLTGAAQAAAILASGRLIVAPGLLAAFDAPLWDVWLAFLPTILAFAAGAWLARDRDRRRTRAVLESAATALAGVFVSVLLGRWIEDDAPLVLLGALTVAWGGMALAQLWRARSGGWLAVVRLALAGVYGAVATLFLGLSLAAVHPVWGLAPDPVAGVLLLDGTTMAFLLPALLLTALARLLPDAPRWPRRVALGGTAALAAMWLALQIRRFWRGPDLAQPGVTTEELYSYTVALLAATLAAVVIGHTLGRPALRTAGLALAALTAVKVFAIDMAGLVGLARAASFIGLGLALAFVGWLHGRLSEPRPV